jgi:hypothetical protein
MREPCPTCGLMACAHQPELPLVPLAPAANLFEFRDIQKFTAACRQQWPGAVIVLRPNSDFESRYPRRGEVTNDFNRVNEFVCEHESAPGDPGNPDDR